MRSEEEIKKMANRFDELSEEYVYDNVEGARDVFNWVLNTQVPDSHLETYLEDV